jgi:hypothetical protein
MGVGEAGLDHVPAEKTLCADEGGEGGEFEGEGAGELVAEEKVGEGDDEGDADDATEDAMAPFHVEYGFEFVEGDGVVQSVRVRAMSGAEETRETYSLNSGVALYLSNSVSHSGWERGGRMPVMGRHSVMLRPDSVRRVTPPTVMTAKTRVDEKRSQRPTGGGERTGSEENGLKKEWRADVRRDGRARVRAKTEREEPNMLSLVRRALARQYSTPPRQLSAGEQGIHDKLKDRFNPRELQVQDISGA